MAEDRDLDRAAGVVVDSAAVQAAEALADSVAAVILAAAAAAAVGRIRDDLTWLIHEVIIDGFRKP